MDPQTGILSILYQPVFYAAEVETTYKRRLNTSKFKMGNLKKWYQLALEQQKYQ
jgi:hypothetical protein